MPLIFNKNSLAVWRIEEPLEVLYNRLDKKELYERQLKLFRSEKRKQEWLAVRVLLKEVLGYEAEIAYRENGEPYLPDHSCRISISHTVGYAAVFLSGERRVGVDIEVCSDKILPLAPKFINTSEEHISGKDKLTHLLLHWSGKEAVYKALGVEGVEFASQLLVAPFEPEQSGSFQLKAKIEQEGTLFTVRYMVDERFVLTWTEQP